MTEWTDGSVINEVYTIDTILRNEHNFAIGKDRL